MGVQPETFRLTPRVDLYVDAYEEALEALNAHVRRHPRYADVHHRLGLLFFLAEDPERAAEHHRRALEINPGYIAAHSALGYALEAAGDPGAAMRTWREASSLVPGSDHPGTGIDLAMAEGRRGAARLGLEALDHVAHSEQFADLVQRERLLLLVLAGDEARSHAVWLRLCERSPAFQAYFAGERLAAAGELEPDRVPDYLAERQTNHNLAEIHVYLSDTYAAFDVMHMAEAELRRGLYANFDLPTYHVRLGRLRRLTGSEEDAATEFHRAIGYDPAHVGARIELGHERAALGQSQEAIVEFEEAARLEPEYADVHHQLGLLYMESGRLEEACAALESALDINPSFTIARAGLGLCYLRQSNDPAAVDAFTHAIDGGLRSADLYLNLGIAHMRQGQTAPALAALQEGVSIGPHYAPLYYHLGRLYRELGNEPEARTSWQRFFEFAGELVGNERFDLYEEDLRPPVAAS